MFNYTDFCADVDTAFAMPGLQKNPMLGSKMPSAETTAPARRSHMALNHSTVQRAAQVEERLQQRIKARRMVIRPYFQDMDKTKSGHITRSQFGRLMSSMGFELDEGSVSALCKVYCDLGNPSDFNYLDFCTNLETRPELEPPSWSPRYSPKASEKQPPPSPRSNPYFDSHGRIRPATGEVQSTNPSFDTF